MPTVQGTIRNPADGSAATGPVYFQLVGENLRPLPAAFLPSSNQTIGGISSVELGANGTYSIALPSNDDIVPAGTRWSRRHGQSGLVILHVELTPATQREEDILADPPGALATAALDTAIAAEAARTRLESLGRIPNQASADALRDLWIAFIRSVGDGSPDHATHQYEGGDVTDCYVNSAGKVCWPGADWFAGAAVDANGFYGGEALPIRNGLIHWDTVNSFVGAIQAHAVGSSGVWLDAVTQLGLPAGTILWPIAGFDDGGVQKILCWHVESPAAGGAPHGRLIDSVIVSINIFLGYDSHVMTGLGALSDKFWISGVLRDTTHTYILGMEFLPDFDARTTGGSQANYVLGDPENHYSLTRIARVANGSFNTVASWTFWNGTSWVAGVANAVPIADTDGQPVRGDLAMKKISTGRYLFGAHPLTDTHLNVYTSTAPQGPLLQTSRIPVADQGKNVNNGIEVGQLCKFLPTAVTTTPAVPAEHSLLMMSCNLIDPAVGYSVPEAWTSINTRRFAPRFVVVPHI